MNVAVCVYGWNLARKPREKTTAKITGGAAIE
jgi:hypothetical protein